MISIFPPPKELPEHLKTERRTHAFPRHPNHKKTNWKALRKSLTRFRTLDAKLDCGYWCPAKYKPNTTRAAKNVESVCCLVWDYDDGTTIHDAVEPWLDYALAVHTSFSHSDDAPRFRIVIPLSEPVPGHGWVKFWRFWYDKLEHKPDQACKDPSRLYHFPAHPNGVTPYGAWCEGEPLPVNPYIWQAPERKPYRPRTPILVRHRLKNLYGECENARRELAKRLNAVEGDNGLFAKIKCPGCGKNTAFFYADPYGAMKGARCQHRNSCKWYGWLEDLEK